MTVRTDIHRPSAINPVDYAMVGCFYQGGSNDMAEAYIGDHLHLDDVLGDGWSSLIGVPDGNYRTKGTCDHCGAHFAHGVIYRHGPTHELLTVGHICADKVMLPGATALARQLELKRRAAEAAKTERENKAYRAQFATEHPKVMQAFAEMTYNDFVADVRRRFEGSYPQLSERQVEALESAYDKHLERQAEKAERDSKPIVPVSAGQGVTIKGKIISTKWQASQYGETLKMLVEDDQGFRVFGSVPGSLMVEDLPGRRVSFIANVTKSDRDETFGFFKRPRKAMFI